MLYSEWLPYCLTIGIDYELFGHMNPKKMQPFIKAYEKKQNNEINQANFIAYLQGAYFLQAMGACLSKNGKYPDEPYDLGIDNNGNSEKAHELTEDEKQKQIENLFMRLHIMQVNFDSNKANEGDGVS